MFFALIYKMNASGNYIMYEALAFILHQLKKMNTGFNYNIYKSSILCNCNQQF